MEQDIHIYGAIVLFALFMLRKKIYSGAVAICLYVFNAVIRIKIMNKINSVDNCKITYVFDTTPAKCVFICDKYARLINITSIYNSLIEKELLSVAQIKAAVMENNALTNLASLDENFKIYAELEYPFNNFALEIDSETDDVLLYNCCTANPIACKF